MSRWSATGPGSLAPVRLDSAVLVETLAFAFAGAFVQAVVACEYALALRRLGGDALPGRAARAESRAGW